MAITHNIDSNARLIVTVCEGEARDIDFITALKKYQGEIQSDPKYIEYNEIVDATMITKIKFTTEGIKTIGQIATTTDRKDKHKKLAFVVSSNLAFGLARMYEAYRSLSKKSNKQIRIFKNKQDALEWVSK